MTLNHIIFQLGNVDVSLATMLLLGSLIFLFILGFFIWKIRNNKDQIASQHRDDLEMRLAEMTGILRQFSSATQDQQAHLTHMLDERLDKVGHRLGLGLSEQSERMAAPLKQLYERIAVIDAAQKNISNLSGEMVSLKEILSNKQARGAYGQARMEALIRDGLPTNAYEFQAQLSNGLRPDCLIRLPDSALKLVIDAKFPLEAFNALRAAKNEADRHAASQRLRGDMLKHIKDVSERYLLVGETHETALMFIPSESVYADIYEYFEDIIQKGQRAHVILASPNILMLLIQTMQAIFKDARMRDQAHLIQIEVSRLLDDVMRLRDRIGDMQRHFSQANTDLEKLTISAEKVVKRGLRIESLDLEASTSPIESIDPKPHLIREESISSF